MLKSSGEGMDKITNLIKAGHITVVLLGVVLLNSISYKTSMQNFELTPFITIIIVFMIWLNLYDYFTISQKRVKE